MVAFSRARNHNRIGQDIEKCLTELNANFYEQSHSGWFTIIAPQLDSSQFGNQIKKFRDDYDRCYDWFLCVKRFLEDVIDKQVKEYLSETKKFTDQKWQADHIRKRILEISGLIHYHILKGEEISQSSLNKKYPKLVGEIKENLQKSDTETSLNLFLKALDSEFQNHKILKRYKKERDELIEYGEGILNKIEDKIDDLKQIKQT